MEFITRPGWVGEAEGEKEDVLLKRGVLVKLR